MESVLKSFFKFVCTHSYPANNLYDLRLCRLLGLGSFTFTSINDLALPHVGGFWVQFWARFSIMFTHTFLRRRRGLMTFDALTLASSGTPFHGYTRRLEPV